MVYHAVRKAYHRVRKVYHGFRKVNQSVRRPCLNGLQKEYCLKTKVIALD